MTDTRVQKMPGGKWALIVNGFIILEGTEQEVRARKKKFDEAENLLENKRIVKGK